ncbi:hypothetical protein [Shewanella sp. 10N.286.48.A6]|uniref:hypothetical protein n=1 Tax=Shewanella sp. 10N.286.48.A6 TaxID=1880833 RepID=UPI000C85DCB3|nr:hypothetical protein [Shewanella sp. 10N.286.48.A6]PMH96253.1 hypothetical protein BCU55_02765 [Shewanella sp. 10N.286.48.A6]
MSLTKEWFVGRDQFIDEQSKLGNYTLEQAMAELDVTLSDFFGLGIICSKELTTASTSLFKLTSLGGLFFVDKYQQLFISSVNLKKLKQALECWDNFTVEFEDANTNIISKISIKKQQHVTFYINENPFIHQLKFRLDDVRDEVNMFSDNESPKLLLSLWEQFCECVRFIENSDKSPSKIEISADSRSIEAICVSWHDVIKNYFSSQMNQIRNEQNLVDLKSEIECSYSAIGGEWDNILNLYSSVRALKLKRLLSDSDDQIETIIEMVSTKSIDEFGLVTPELVESRAIKKNLCIALKSDDVLIYKDRVRKQIKVAYFLHEKSTEFNLHTNQFFRVLRSKGNSNWDGKRLFLFLQSQAGKKLLEYTFLCETAYQRALPQIDQRQLNLLKVPMLSDDQATVLDTRLTDLLELIHQRQRLKKQIIRSLDAM